MTQNFFSRGEKVVVFREAEYSPEELPHYIELPVEGKIEEVYREEFEFDYKVMWHDDGSFVRVYEEEIKGCEHENYVWHDKRQEYFCPFCES